MRSQVSAQSHLEYRPSGFHWRRRLPQRVLKTCTPLKKMLLVFPLRTHVIPDAKALAQKLTAAFDLACAHAAVETLRHAIATRDREKARNPLREVAARLNIALNEADSDWRRLAFRALRVMLDAEQENLRRDHGIYEEPSAPFRTARTLLDTGNIPIQPIALPTHSAPVAPRDIPATPCSAPVPISSPLPTVADPTPAQPVPSETAPAKPASADAATEVAQVVSTCPDIGTGAGLYIELRSKGYRTFKPTEQVNKKSGESWARNSAPNVRSTAALFSRIFENKPFDQVSDEEMTAAWEIVARLPRSYQAKTSKKTPQEAADDADATERHNAEVTRAKMKKQGASPGNIEYEILKGRIRRLRTGTIYRHMQDFQRICKFLVKKGHLSRNIMEGHIWDSDECDRRETLEEDNERLTWFGKLDGLFRTPLYQNELEDVGDPMFWAPLIALHMGLRSEEILQLRLDDIEITNDIPCIVLKQGPGQSLKSKAARRTVPIHDNLLRLGFMQLVALRRREGEDRLFPWLERSQSKKTFTENFSKRFTKYRQDHGIYDAQRDFHSFRTTFNDLVILAERQDSHRRALMGHVEHDVGITNYNPSGFSMTTLRDCVNAVEVDISMIRSPFAEVDSAQVTDLAARRIKTFVDRHAKLTPVTG